MEIKLDIFNCTSPSKNFTAESSTNRAVCAAVVKSYFVSWKDKKIRKKNYFLLLQGKAYLMGLN